MSRGRIEFAPRERDPMAKKRTNPKQGNRGRATAPAVPATGAALAAPSGSRVWLRPWFAAALVVAALIVAYAPSLDAPFYFDDNRNIVHNPLVRELSWFARPWAVDESGANHFHLHSFKTRFITNLSFALNYRFGGLAVRGFHGTNIALHALAALLVGLGIRRALQLPLFESSAVRPDAGRIALVAAALFALHPIQTETVTYTVQRAALLAGCFSLAAFWAYLRALGASGRARLGWAAACFAALGFGSMSKQNAVIFPLVLLLFDLLFVARSRRARGLWVAIPLAALLIVPLQRLYLLVSSVGSERLIERATSLAEGVGRFDYFRTELGVVVRYLGLLFLPVGQTLEHDVRISSSVAEPALLAAGALLATLFGLGCWLAWERGRGGQRDPAWRLVGFGILWFFVCLAVESTFIPIPDPMLEHRLYLPSAGFLLSITLAVALAGRDNWRRRRLAILALVTLPLAAASFARNAVWADPRLFWYDMLAKSPSKARVVYNVGYFELQQGRREAALELFGKTVALDPAYGAAWIWIGNLERARSNYDASARAYESAIEVDPKNWVTRLDLRTVRLRQGDLMEADRLWQEAVRLAGSVEAVETVLRKAGSEVLLPKNLPPLTPRP